MAPNADERSMTDFNVMCPRPSGVRACGHVVMSENLFSSNEERNTEHWYPEADRGG